MNFFTVIEYIYLLGLVVVAGFFLIVAYVYVFYVLPGRVSRRFSCWLGTDHRTSSCSRCGGFLGYSFGRWRTWGRCGFGSRFCSQTGLRWRSPELAGQKVCHTVVD